MSTCITRPAGSLADKRPCVLVVDDDPAIRNLLQHLLEAEGYGVRTAEDADEALAVAAELKCKLNVLLTDMMMPGLDGHDLIASIRRLCPFVDTVLVSGALPADDGRNKSYKILLKPFRSADLLATIKELIDGQIW